MAEQQQETVTKEAKSDGADEPRSRAEERIQHLLVEREKDREEQARMREELAFLKGHVSAQPKALARDDTPDFSKYEDPDERRDAMLAHLQRQNKELQERLAQDLAERAHAAIVTRAMRGLNFGSAEEDLQDAEDAISAYARHHTEPETRAYAQRWAKRVAAQQLKEKQPTTAEQKTAQDQDYVERKKADAAKAARSEGATAAAPAKGLPEPLHPRSGAKKADVRKAFLTSLAAEAQAEREAER